MHKHSHCMLPGRGPGHMAPPVPAGRLLRRAPRPSVVSWPLVRTSRPALAAGPLPLGAVGRARGRRPRGSLACPPAPPLGPCARCRAPWALAAPVWFAPCHPLRLRAPCGCPCSAPARLLPARGPRGAAAGPLRGFGPGGSSLCPRCAAFGPRFFSVGAELWLRACACARLLPLSLLPPPPLPPRWGSRGARGLRPECRFSRPSRGCAASRGRPPVRRFRCSCHS